jgi:hypothetical protein
LPLFTTFRDEVFSETGIPIEIPALLRLSADLRNLSPTSYSLLTQLPSAS